jgi:hypothetical protein
MSKPTAKTPYLREKSRRLGSVNGREIDVC